MIYVVCPNIKKRHEWQRTINIGWCSSCSKRNKCKPYQDIKEGKQ